MTQGPGTTRAKQSLLIIGAGAHCRTVAEAVTAASQYEVIGFADNDVSKHGAMMGAWKVLGDWRSIVADSYFVSIGVNSARRFVFDQLLDAGLAVAKIISPRAFVSEGAEIGPGSLVLAGAVVQAAARVGRNVLINAGAVIDHDAVVGDHAHVGPNATVGSFGKVLPEEVLMPGEVRWK